MSIEKIITGNYASNEMEVVVKLSMASCSIIE